MSTHRHSGEQSMVEASTEGFVCHVRRRRAWTHAVHGAFPSFAGRHSCVGMQFMLQEFVICSGTEKRNSKTLRFASLVNDVQINDLLGMRSLSLRTTPVPKC